MTFAHVCVRHPSVAANWTCTRCGRWHCDACVRPISARQEQALRGPKGCAHCPGLLKQGEQERPIDTLWDLVARPLSIEGALTVGALSVPGIVAALGGLVTFIFAVVYASVLAGFYVQVVAHVAAREEGLPFGSTIQHSGDMVSALLRGVFALAMGFGPGLLLFWMVPLLWPIAVVLALAGLAVVPASLLSGMLSQSYLDQLWPPSWLPFIRRAPQAYGRLLLEYHGMAVVWLLTMLLLSWLLAPVYLLGVVAVPTANTLFAVWHACLLGRFLQREAATFGLRY